ncbi:MAG TPA: hypothetical protein VF720_15455 [Candidatus Eisenbacteria bacterium]
MNRFRYLLLAPLLLAPLACGKGGSPGAPKPIIIIGSSSIWGEVSPCG